MGLILTFSLRYRRGTGARRGPLRELVAREFEITWTAATFFLFFFLFWFTASAQFTTLVPPRDAMEVHVTGKQWMWKTQHGNGAREINTLHVPVNVPVRVVLTSEDVIHSFFVPAFRIKRDVLPGRYLETWFKATKTGTFHLFCTQFCGTQHSRMIGSVVVMPQDEFAKWLRAQPQADDIAKEGAALFVSLGCAGCHEGNSAVHAPGLAGVYGGPVQLSDGRRWSRTTPISAIPSSSPARRSWRASRTGCRALTGSSTTARYCASPRISARSRTREGDDPDVAAGWCVEQRESPLTLSLSPWERGRPVSTAVEQDVPSPMGRGTG